MPNPTPNKGYAQQTTGTNINVWGEVVNTVFAQIDTNVGGRAYHTLSVGTYTVSETDAQNLFLILSGTLTGNVNYVLPNRGGLFFIQNNTVQGAYTITVKPSGGTGISLQPLTVTGVGINPDNSTASVIASSESDGAFYPYRTVTATYNVTASDRLILLNATNAPFTVVLLPPAQVAGQRFDFKKIDGSDNAITLQGLIDDDASFILAIQNEAISVESVGTVYRTVSDTGGIISAGGAAASAAAAAESAAAAQSSRWATLAYTVRAEEAAAFAEAYASGLTLNNIYETIAAGIAATSSGQWFYVIGDNTYTFLLLYKNTAGVGIQRGASISASMFARMIAKLEPIMGFGGTGNVAPITTFLPPNGPWRVSLGFNHTDATLYQGIPFYGPGWASTIGPFNNPVHRIFEGSGRVPLLTINGKRLLDIDPDTLAVFLFGEEIGSSGGGSGGSVLTLEPLDPAFLPVFAQVNGFVVYGASSAVGADALPALNTTPSNRHLMPGQGVHTTKPGISGATGNNAGDGTFAALVEEEADATTGATTGETCCSTAVKSFVRRWALTNTGTPPMFIAGSPGHGDRLISGLDPSSTWYPNLTYMIDQSWQYAHDHSMTWGLPFICWVHGNDMGDTTTYAAYKAALANLIDAVKAYVLAKTNPSFTGPFPHWIASDADMNGTKTNPEPDLALVDLANERDDLHLVSGLFLCPHTTEHPSNIGQDLNAEYWARAMQQLAAGYVPQQQNWTNAYYDGTEIVMSGVWPTMPPSINTRVVQTALDFGVSAYDDDGLFTLSNIYAQDDGTIHMTPERPVTAAKSPKAANRIYNSSWGGNRVTGNVFDSTTETVTIGDSQYVLASPAKPYILDVEILE